MAGGAHDPAGGILHSLIASELRGSQSGQIPGSAPAVGAATIAQTRAQTAIK